LAWAELWAATCEAAAWWTDPERGLDLLLVEGVGGVLCPIADDATVADLAVALDYPCLVIARRGLGTVSHTLLSVEALISRGLRVAGVILNDADGLSAPDDPAVATNPQELARWLPPGVAILASLDHHHRGDGAPLSREFALIEWMDRAARPRRPIVGP
jgi:dethiobiotin synthetase